MPSYPRCIALEDGSLIYVKGDENCKWGETEDGYTILPMDNGWVYAQQTTSGYAAPSTYKVSKVINNEVKAFLQTQPLRIPIKIHNKKQLHQSPMHSSLSQSQKVIGDRKALVVLMAFDDLDFIKANYDFDRLFNEIGYADDGAMGSVKDYFLWSSYGQLNFTCDVIGPFKASHEMKYYGKNIGSSGQDKAPLELFKEALSYATQNVDLADYDSNNDGYVDNIHIIFAGYGEESGAKSDAIWSHEMTFPAIEIEGVKIDRYSCAPELRGNYGKGISRIGPHCHEMGHALGAMDYYDVDYSENGNFSGTGNWDIMASGSWNNEGITPPDFNPYVKIFDFGWCQPQTFEEGYNKILPAYESNDQIFMLSTPIDEDFYLVENRQQTGFDSGIPGRGLLIFHIGPDIDSRKPTNSVNSLYPQQCYVVCAAAETQYPTNTPSSYGDINTSGCTFPGLTQNTEFSDFSIPAAFSFNGAQTGIMLSEITEEENFAISLYNGTPPLPTYIWTEDFESVERQEYWTQENDDWKFSKSASNDNHFGKGVSTNTMPIKHDTNYLYSKYPSSFNNKETIRQIHTPSFIVEQGREYDLELEYYNSPQIISSGNNRNTLNIYFKTGDNELKLLSTLEDTEYDWVTTKIEVNNYDYSGDASFLIEGHGSSSGYICIDNILLQEKGESRIRDLTIFDSIKYGVSINDNTITLDSPCSSSYAVYDITGRMVKTGFFETGKSSFTLPNGMFIIHFSNSQLSSMKIIV